MTWRAAVGAILVLGVGCAGSPRRDQGRRVAADFALPTLDGHIVHLADLRGGPVVLNFWASWCAPCRIETPWLVELYAEYRTFGVEVVGISLDEPGDREAVSVFARRMRIPYPVLFGTRDVAARYGGVRFMPQTFFISGDGNIRESTIGITSKEDIAAAIRRLLTAVAKQRK